MYASQITCVPVKGGAGPSQDPHLLRNLGRGLLLSPAPGPEAPHDRVLLLGVLVDPWGQVGGSCLLGAAVPLWQSAAVWGRLCRGPHLTV